MNAELCMVYQPLVGLAQTPGGHHQTWMQMLVTLLLTLLAPCRPVVVNIGRVGQATDNVTQRVIMLKENEKPHR